MLTYFVHVEFNNNSKRFTFNTSREALVFYDSSINIMKYDKNKSFHGIHWTNVDSVFWGYFGENKVDAICDKYPISKDNSDNSDKTDKYYSVIIELSNQENKRCFDDEDDANNYFTYVKNQIVYNNYDFSDANIIYLKEHGIVDEIKKLYDRESDYNYHNL